MTKFAAYDDQAIWGVGNTAAEALADAEQWVSGGDVPHHFNTAPMTKALAAKVERLGGNVAFGKVNGTLMTYAGYDRSTS